VWRSSPERRRGIGEATARALAADGHRVALLARRVDRIQTLTEDIGESAVAIEADVTERDSIAAAADRVQADLGGADILINNAGVMLLGPFSEEQESDYRQMIETNLLGAITTTEAFLDQLRDGGGDLVNTRRSPDERRDRETRSTPPPSGASTAGQSRCARSFSPTSA
jgi:NADP-dependent 3-hydroxy acid dehydrogenase YdfG